MMNGRRLIAVLCLGVMFVAGSATGTITLPGIWQAPDGGYDGIYDAVNGLLPEASTPAWLGTYDSSAGASEAMTAGGTILTVVNSATTGPLYTMATAAAQGTATGSMTLDMRLKLQDIGTTNNFEFSISVNRPASAAQQAGGINSVQYYFRFSNNASSYLKLGHTWRDVRIIIDANTQTARIYLDGSSVAETGFPVNTLVITTSTTALNQIRFGDGGSTTGIGGFDLAYFAWTNDEMAAVEERASLKLILFTSK